MSNQQKIERIKKIIVFCDENSVPYFAGLQNAYGDFQWLGVEPDDRAKIPAELMEGI